MPTRSFGWLFKIDLLPLTSPYLEILLMLSICIEELFFLQATSGATVLSWIQSLKLKLLWNVGAGTFTGSWRWDSAMPSSYSWYSCASNTLFKSCRETYESVEVQQEMVQNTIICVTGRVRIFAVTFIQKTIIQGMQHLFPNFSLLQSMA